MKVYYHQSGCTTLWEETKWTNITHKKSWNKTQDCVCVISSSCYLPCTYCSTMTGTRPHFPAVNTWPPSTATASASLRCGAIQSRDECHRVETKNNKLTDFDISSRVYHNLLQALFNCRGVLAFNGGGVPRHTADAPRVTLCGLSMAHSTPSDGRGCIVWCLL